MKRGESTIWTAVVMIVVAALQGCATEPGRRIQALFTPHAGEAALATGLKQYENGDYADSARNLTTAIDQGLREQDQVRAHKHLAFIHCASSREQQCRDAFRKALAVDPSLELSAAEVGHPIWGPVFRSLKSGR